MKYLSASWESMQMWLVKMNGQVKIKVIGQCPVTAAVILNLEICWVFLH